MRLQLRAQKVKLRLRQLPLPLGIAAEIIARLRESNNGPVGEQVGMKPDEQHVKHSWRCIAKGGVKPGMAQGKQKTSRYVNQQRFGPRPLLDRIPASEPDNRRQKE